jgi:hypothetical protein
MSVLIGIFAAAVVANSDIEFPKIGFCRDSKEQVGLAHFRVRPVRPVPICLYALQFCNIVWAAGTGKRARPPRARDENR